MTIAFTCYWKSQDGESSTVLVLQCNSEFSMDVGQKPKNYYISRGNYSRFSFPLHIKIIPFQGSNKTFCHWPLHVTYSACWSLFTATKTGIWTVSNCNLTFRVSLKVTQLFRNPDQRKFRQSLRDQPVPQHTAYSRPRTQGGRCHPSNMLIWIKSALLTKEGQMSEPDHLAPSASIYHGCFLIYSIIFFIVFRKDCLAPETLSGLFLAVSLGKKYTLASTPLPGTVPETPTLLSTEGNVGCGFQLCIRKVILKTGAIGS